MKRYATKDELRAVLSPKELFVFDMDGTVYLGDRVFDFALAYIRKLRENGKRVLFFTNNASRSCDVYYDRLRGMGFDPRNGEIMTAGDVTIAFLNRHRPGKTVYLIGTPQLEQSFRDGGIPLSDGKTADIVVSSFDMTLTYEKVNTGCRLIREGAEYLSTHPDMNCPAEGGMLVDSGSIAAMMTASTGVKPRYFGKPSAETAEMIAEVTGVAKEKICVFGDRTETDIAVGRKNGIDSCLVLTGVTSESDLPSLDGDREPTVVIASIETLLVNEIY